jgi:hypothetical protein
LKAFTLRPTVRGWERNRNRQADKLKRQQDRQCSRLAGEIEAADEATATEKATAEFKVPATTLSAFIYG